MTPEFIGFLAIGFLAQVVDGALGMAYGVTASTLLLLGGLPPAAASATVHAAECLTTGASAISHRAFGNVDRAIFRRLLLPGVLGAILGAYILVHLPGDSLKPYVAGYLVLMGCVILGKAFREFPARVGETRLGILGFAGALVDALGGGGWGPIVATTLIVRGNPPRQVVGTVSAVEFFVTLAASATFLLTIGFTRGDAILGLALGGLAGAPLGAWVCRRVPVRPLMILIGTLVILLSLRTLWKCIGAA